MGKRLIYLDVLRAAAILLVIGRHQLPFPADSVGASFLSIWQRCGWCGVDLFFCLSGFLIGGLLFDEYGRHRAIDVKRFYIRRGFKIWPSYFVFVFAAIAGHLAVQHPLNGAVVRSFVWECWPNFVHLQNYFGTPFAQTWSLAVEEHFYLLLPLFLLLLIRYRPNEPFRPIPWLLPLVLAACLGMRIVTARHVTEFDRFKLIFPTHLRIDSLFAGVVLGYWVYFNRENVERFRRLRWVLLFVGILFFVPTAVWDEETRALHTWGLLGLIVGSVCITLWSWFESTGGREAVRPARWLALIGGYSYSIYLWHSPFGIRFSERIVGHVLAGSDRRVPLAMAASMVVLSMVMGVVAYKLIEWPALRFRDRWFPTRSARSVPETREPSALPPFDASPSGMEQVAAAGPRA